MRYYYSIIITGIDIIIAIIFNVIIVTDIVTIIVTIFRTNCYYCYYFCDRYCCYCYYYYHAFLFNVTIIDSIVLKAADDKRPIFTIIVIIIDFIIILQ